MRQTTPCLKKTRLGNLVKTRSNLNQFVKLFHHYKYKNRIKFEKDVIQQFSIDVEDYSQQMKQNQMTF